MGIAKFIIFLLAVFIIILLLAFLLPSRVTVAKSVEVNAPRQNIMNQIVNFEEWKNWYPAFKDENISVIKNEASADYITSVTLKNKNGTAIVLNLIDTSNNQIDIRLQSSSSTKVTYQFLLIPKSNNEHQLTWNINIDMGWYPWKRVQGIL